MAGSAIRDLLGDQPSTPAVPGEVTKPILVVDGTEPASSSQKTAAPAKANTFKGLGASLAASSGPPPRSRSRKDPSAGHVTAKVPAAIVAGSVITTKLPPPPTNTPAEPVAVEEPAAAAVEEPAAVETPSVEKTAVEEPAVETPAVEEPAVETPTVEEPATVETPADSEVPSAAPQTAQADEPVKATGPAIHSAINPEKNVKVKLHMPDGSYSTVLIGPKCTAAEVCGTVAFRRGYHPLVLYTLPVDNPNGVPALRNGSSLLLDVLRDRTITIEVRELQDPQHKAEARKMGYSTQESHHYPEEKEML